MMVSVQSVHAFDFLLLFILGRRMNGLGQLCTLGIWHLLGST